MRRGGFLLLLGLLGLLGGSCEAQTPHPTKPPRVELALAHTIRPFTLVWGGTLPLQTGQDMLFAWRNDYLAPLRLQTVSCRTLEGTVVIRPQLSGGGDTSIVAEPCTCTAEGWTACRLQGQPVVQPIDPDGASCPTPTCSLDIMIVEGGGTGLRVPVRGVLE